MARVCSFIFFLLLVLVCSTSIALTQLRMLGSYGNPPDSLGYTHPLGGWTYVAGFDSTYLESRFTSSGDSLFFNLDGKIYFMFSADGGRTFDTTSFIRQLYPVDATGIYWHKGGHGWAIVNNIKAKMFGSYVFSEFGKVIEYYPFDIDLSRLFNTEPLMPSVFLSEVQVQPTNENIVFVSVASSSQIYSHVGYLTSRDGGKTWEFLFIPQSFYQVTGSELILNYRNPDKYILNWSERIGTDQRHKDLTIDNGKTWNPYTLPATFTDLLSSERGSRTLMYGIRDEDELRAFQGITYSTSPTIYGIRGIISNQVGKKTWLLDLYGDKLNEYNNKYSVCKIVGEENVVSNTISPNYWIDPQDPHKAIIQVQASHRDSLYYPSFQESSLFYTTNDGETWQRIMYYQYAKPATRLGNAQIAFDSGLKYGFIAIRTYYDLESYNKSIVTLWKYTPEILDIEVGKTDILTQYAVTPNPSSSQVTLTFTPPSPARVEIGLFDLLGAKVANVFEGVVNAQEQVVIWNGVREVASGVYYLQLNLNQSTITKQIIIQH